MKLLLTLGMPITISKRVAAHPELAPGTLGTLNMQKMMKVAAGYSM